jgi:hypothetical protein
MVNPFLTALRARILHLSAQVSVAHEAFRDGILEHGVLFAQPLVFRE